MNFLLAMLCDQTARKYFALWASGRELASILVALARFRMFLGASLASRGSLADPVGAPGARRGRRAASRDAPETLLSATGRPEKALGSNVTRFGVPRGSFSQNRPQN